MGFRYRSSIRLARGIRINFSKSGASLSVGRPGATVNFSKRGTRATVGLPGTGLSWSTRIKPPAKATHAPDLTAPPQISPEQRVVSAGDGLSRSSVAWLVVIGLAVGIVAALLW